MIQTVKKYQQGKVSYSPSQPDSLRVDEDKIITIKQGVIGFPELNRYLLDGNIENTPFLWLKSVDSPALRFLVVDPLAIKPDYHIKLGKEELKDINLTDISKLLILVILTIPEDMAGMTVNLKGPIIINPEARLARQIVLVDDAYPTKYFVFAKKGRSRLF